MTSKKVNGFTPRKFKIPDFTTIFPHKKSQFIDRPEQKDWLKQLFEFSSMCEKSFEKIRGISQFAAIFYPNCADIQRYENMFKISLQLFIVDDHSDVGNDPSLDISTQVEKSEVIWRQMDSVMDKLTEKDKFVSMVNWRPYVVYNFMIYEAISQEYNVNQMKRLAKVSKECYAGAREENRLISSGSLLPTIEENINLRLSVSGAYVGLQSVEYCDNICLEEKDWQNPLFQKFRDLAASIIVLDNDVYSFEKEFVEGNCNLKEMCMNAVAIEALFQKCDIETAIANVIKRLVKGEEECDAVCKQILADPSTGDAMKKYIDSILHMIGGNHWLSKNAPRYNKYTLNSPKP